MFFVPQGIGFWFLLWPWPLLSRSSRESVFHQNGFFPNFVKSTRGILIKRVRKLHREVAHDLIIVDLQLTYFCIYCVVLKLAILWPRSLSSKIISWIWFLHTRNLWAVIKIHLITLDLGWPISLIVSRSFITDQLDTSNWANPCSFLWWMACLLLPGELSFDFCYDLDLCSQGQVVRAFFIRMGFSLILSKIQGGFWSNVSESFIERWHMTWLLLTFSWPTFAYTV